MNPEVRAARRRRRQRRPLADSTRLLEPLHLLPPHAVDAVLGELEEPFRSAIALLVLPPMDAVLAEIQLESYMASRALDYEQANSAYVALEQMQLAPGGNR